MTLSTAAAATGTSALDKYSIANSQENQKKDDELGKNEFLELLVAQMNNQNPLEPQENGEFIAQLAQFSTVEGVEQLNTSMQDFVAGMQSSQALQASSLVGRTVMLGMENTQVETGRGTEGLVVLPASTPDLTINVYSPQGDLVKQIPLGTKEKGNIEFKWDGKDADGNVMPSGEYRFEAKAAIDGKSQQVPTVLPAHVNSITLGAAGTGDVILNLDGMGSVLLSDVQMIKE
ncbi:flagellar hook assembly protein FlgD [Aestuariirhabdus sp. Z084]|uniref:flagellar hook assembly protein FlgD n=1 Tax=Aestuariirhabdus haliotis TaxID=2918751 RepID=UPI00201B35FE|nr:flagellar hook assembly protein FlgD [Aestuariirhabdus haliotis]MCL6414442.1 flagellar hook assembly protein FlgD [Aestuariirhabdus haliotis]MCL6418576.1 flagellar hook assembly protein FlgD [Aestuariirhabdus haliotis]